MTIDSIVLELSLQKLSEAFDEFIGECVDEGKPKQPTISAVMKARGYLPPTCKHAYRK